MEQGQSDWFEQFWKGFVFFFRGPTKIESSLLLERLEKEAMSRFDKDSLNSKLVVLSEELRLSHKELLSLYKSLQSSNLSFSKQTAQVEGIFDQDSFNFQRAQDFFESLGRFIRYIGTLFLDIHNGSEIHSCHDRFVTILTQANSLLGTLKESNLTDFVQLFGPLGLREDMYFDLEGRLFSIHNIGSEIVDCLSVSPMDKYGELSLVISELNSHLSEALKARNQSLQIVSRLNSLRELKSLREQELLDLETKKSLAEQEVSLDAHLGKDEIKQQIEKIEDSVFLFLVRLRDVLVLLADLNSNYDFLAFTTQLEEFQQHSLTFLDQDVLLSVGNKLQEIAERIEFGVLCDVEGAKFSFDDLFSQWQNGDIGQMYEQYSFLKFEQKELGIDQNKVKPITEMTSFESKIGDLKYRIEHFSSQEGLLVEKKGISRQEEGMHIDQALNVKEQIESMWHDFFDHEIEVVFSLDNS